MTYYAATKQARGRPAYFMAAIFRRVPAFSELAARARHAPGPRRGSIPKPPREGIDGKREGEREGMGGKKDEEVMRNCEEERKVEMGTV